MLHLANLSNHEFDRNVIANDPLRLERFLAEHELDGLELLFWEDWNPALHRTEWIKGAHLRFWPDWLDFWRGDLDRLAQRLGGEDNVRAAYGSLSRDAWVNRYRQEIATAVSAGARYLVLHVSQIRPEEMYNWQFSALDDDVISATLELVAELADSIPDHVELLFENLWWPGLTLQNRADAEKLLTASRHRNCGLMLDIGHLMNGQPGLASEEQGIEHALAKIAQLGDLQPRIRGLHLHYSLSADYVADSRRQDGPYDLTSLMRHVGQIDQHRPFSSSRARELLAAASPAYVVHEFMFASLDEWSDKIRRQRRALRGQIAEQGAEK